MKNKYSKFMGILLFILMVILFVLVFMLNIINIFIYILIVLILLFIYYFVVKLSVSKKKIKKIFGNILVFILNILLIVINIYLFNTTEFMRNINNTSYKYETYNLYVNKDSKYNNIKDLNNKDIGIYEVYDNKGLNKFKENIDKKISVKYKKSDDIVSLSNKLIDKEVDGIILENGQVDILKEENPDLINSFKSIYEKEIKIKVKDISKNVDIVNKPFNIYISGVDTYGKITSATRSDVNMIISINNNTDKIHITWIPRDYMVDIKGSSYKDKLTHTGIYGTDMSIYSLSNLLNIDINYYVKVNFTSLIDITNALGGIDVYNDYNFVSQDNIRYKKGNIHLDGEEALSFVRERKNLPNGDFSRGENQVKVLKALIDKALSPKIITKYNSLLNGMDGKFVTNMDMKDIINYLKEEIKNPSNYEITSYELKGDAVYDYTYSYKKQKLSVVKQNEESINKAKEEIKKVLT